VSDVDHYARVTFDRSIEAHRTASWSPRPPVDGWSRFDEYWIRAKKDPSVVLELKCHSCIPWWMTDLIRSHALKRQSFSKYSIGIHLTGLEQGADLVARRSARGLR
jgi:hypothetical protein